MAVNVLNASGSDANVLPDVLRGWYGDGAWQPGSAQIAVFERAREGYTLSPAGAEPAPSDAPCLWSPYPRVEAARLLGVDFKGFEAQSGVVDRPGMLLLFVTFDKSGKPEEHRYEDALLSATEFRWQGQNRRKRESRVGRMIAQRGTPPEIVHLFVRARSKGRSGATEPFTYCGLLTFERWENDNPISVWWRLAEAVPESLHATLRVPNPLALSARRLLRPNARPSIRGSHRYLECRPCHAGLVGPSSAGGRRDAWHRGARVGAHGDAPRPRTRRWAYPHRHLCGGAGPARCRALGRHLGAKRATRVRVGRGRGDGADGSGAS